MLTRADAEHRATTIIATSGGRTPSFSTILLQFNFLNRQGMARDMRVMAVEKPAKYCRNKRFVKINSG